MSIVLLIIMFMHLLYSYLYFITDILWFYDLQFSAPTLSAVQDWLRRKKHLELLICRDTFFQNTGDYYCRLIRLSDGLSRDTHPRNSYDQALMDGIKQALTILS
ncbi:MAG: hypothetical protein AUK63_1901 [bacterium P3]|nr:MAG: hypothetical protein AUK63_1901 [bacterium P3]KWW37196.1 MAG: hypothetical protein F083_2349 [bacterium F083]